MFPFFHPITILFFFFLWFLSVVVTPRGSWHPPFLLPFWCRKLSPCSSLVHSLIHHPACTFSPTVLAYFSYLCNTRHLQRKSGHEAMHDLVGSIHDLQEQILDRFPCTQTYFLLQKLSNKNHDWQVLYNYFQACFGKAMLVCCFFKELYSHAIMPLNQNTIGGNSSSRWSAQMKLG